jgi:hypothetical protein
MAVKFKFVAKTTLAVSSRSIAVVYLMKAIVGCAWAVAVAME